MIYTSRFRKILERDSGKEIPKRASTKWFRQSASKIQSVNTKNLFVDSEVSKTILPGHMYHFFYDPKLKKQLPYYDTFPLIFPIEMYSDGFLGINLHYLPPGLRATLMDALYSNVTNTKKNEKTRLDISYSILNAASKYKYFKPTIKRYLFSQLRSNFLKIHAKDWQIALFLPSERFKKAGTKKVWSDSRR